MSLSCCCCSDLLIIVMVIKIMIVTTHNKRGNCYLIQWDPVEFNIQAFTTYLQLHVGELLTDLLTLLHNGIQEEEINSISQ
jgi:hypothetical protein